MFTVLFVVVTGFIIARIAKAILRPIVRPMVNYVIINKTGSTEHIIRR